MTGEPPKDEAMPEGPENDPDMPRFSPPPMPAPPNICVMAACTAPVLARSPFAIFMPKLYPHISLPFKGPCSTGLWGKCEESHESALFTQDTTAFQADCKPARKLLMIERPQLTAADAIPRNRAASLPGSEEMADMILPGRLAKLATIAAINSGMMEPPTRSW